MVKVRVAPGSPTTLVSVPSTLALPGDLALLAEYKSDAVASCNLHEYDGGTSIGTVCH